MRKKYKHGKYDFRACDGCRYLGFINGGTPLCNYMVYTGNPRGCPVGNGCTRKDTRKPNRDPFDADLGFGEGYDVQEN